MYRELDDNELIYMIKEDNDYYDIMIEKYKPVVIGICKKCEKKGKKFGYELEDLIQVANMGVYEAIINYKDNQNTLFYTYVIHCIKNKLRTEFRNQLTYKKMALNLAVSYDKTIEGTDISLLDIIPDKHVISPFDYLIIQENEINYINFLNSLPFEVAVIFELKNNGFSIDEISEFLSMQKRDIFKCLKTAKRKLYV